MRILLTIFFLRVWSNLCFCYVNPCNKKWAVVHLSNGKENDELNEFFRQSLQGTRNIEFLDLPYNKTRTSIFKDDLMSIHEVQVFKFMRKIDNNAFVFLHLNATEFYENNYDKTSHSIFLYAEDGKVPVKSDKVIAYSCIRDLEKPYGLYVENEHEEEINTKKNIYKKAITNCERDITQYNAKLVSKNILEFPALYDHIADFTGTNSYVPEDNLCKSQINIVMCGDREPPYEFYLFDILHEPNCENLKADPMTIAVLAPKSFPVSEKMYKTTIFYNEQNPSPETDMFENAIIWPQLKTEKITYALHKFLKTNNWIRVAIISDNSPTSQNIERELTALFDKDGFIYASRSCDVLNCDFAELLKPFLKVRPRLIIANVNEEYAAALTEQIRKMQIPKLTWFFRAWLNQEVKTAINKGLRDVFSITLDHVDTVSATLTNLLDNINQYLEDFGSSNDKFLEDLKNNVKTIHGSIANGIATKIKDANIRATVVYSNRKVADMIITPSNNVKDYKTHNSLPSAAALVDVGDSMFKSSVYMKPCYDEEFMFFTLVIAVFVLLLVAIVYFFQSAEISYSRMSR